MADEGVIEWQAEPCCSDEPSKKRQKFMDISATQDDGKLEDRLSGILCCVVCLDLPRMTVFQCPNGHLMCSGCLMHLLADGRLKDEVALCPTCRCEISKPTCIRNLAVEKAVSELPASCQFCNKSMPRHAIDRHEREVCVARPVQCKYVSLGCEWGGVYSEVHDHETMCTYPQKTGEELMAHVKLSEEKLAQGLSIYKNIFELLSLEKITITDLQLRPFHTDEYVTKLFFETSRFTAFTLPLTMKAHVAVDDTRNPVLSCNRSLSYQLLLKAKPQNPIVIKFFLQRGPNGDADLRPAVEEFQFSGDRLETPNYELPLTNQLDCNRLLSLKAINLRLVLFQL